MNDSINLTLLGLGYIFININSTAISAAVTYSLSGVVSAEYYFDTDPGQGNGTPLAVSGGTATAIAASIHFTYAHIIKQAIGA